MTTAVATEIHGTCAPGFERVKEAFAANFENGLEVGASFAATREGEMVVDLWGGTEDPAGTRPWRRDTLANVWSTTKAMTAISASILADRGLLDFDAPVAKYWPEFGAAGKERIPMRQLISHQAGVPSIIAPMSGDVFLDWDAYAGALAAETPWWEPGTANGTTRSRLATSSARSSAGSPASPSGPSSARKWLAP